MASSRQHHWEAVYRDKDTDEVSWFEPSPTQSLRALEMVGANRKDSLIDVGGGASHLADALLERGWKDVTVLDISQAALARSRQRLGDRATGVSWHVGDILSWKPTRTFDIWHDRAVFHFFTDPADRAAYRAVLEASLNEGGAIIMAMFAPDGPEKCSGLPVRRYDGESLAKELGESFALVESWEDAHPTPWGAEQRFSWNVLRRD